MKAPPRTTTAHPGTNPGRPLGSGNPSSYPRNIPRRRTGSQSEFRRLARLAQCLRRMADGHSLRRQVTPAGDYWSIAGDRVPLDIALRLFMVRNLEVENPGLFGGHDLAQSYRLYRK
jgi:hypothetical protein